MSGWNMLARPRTAKADGSTSDRLKRGARLGLSAIPLLILVVWTVIPFLVTISASLKTRGEVFGNYSLIPENVTFAAYEQILTDSSFWRTFLNSVIVGAGTAILAMIIAVPAAYAFARFRFRGRHLLLLFVLLPRLVPDVGTMIPLFKLASRAGLIDQHITLIVVYSGLLLPLGVWLLVGFFQQIPGEIEESALVDGATLWQRLRYLVLPLATPAIITVVILAFREAWNEFSLVLVLTSTEAARTLPYALFLLGHGGVQNVPVSAAFALLTVVPFVLVYTRFERYVVAGITAGAGK